MLAAPRIERFPAQGPTTGGARAEAHPPAVLRYDATRAECLVLTYAEGMLSALAHDLQIRVDTFSIAVDEATLAIDARFDARSLRVVGAVRGGVVDATALSADDARTIEATIAREVLATERHAEIRFTGSSVEARGSELRVVGTLALCGRSRAIEVLVRPEGPGADGGGALGPAGRARAPRVQEAARLVAEATVHQPAFGITPYRALLGALRVRPDVRVRLVVPYPSAGSLAAGRAASAVDAGDSAGAP